MSSSSHFFQNNPPFHQVVLTELDIDHIKAWASTVKNKPLTDDEVNRIKADLSASHYHSLAHNIHGLITNSLNNESYSGLMPNDIAELVKLIKQKAQVTQRIRDAAEVSPEDMRSVIEHEKKIRPLNLTMTWWTERLEFLKEENNWNLFISLTLKNYQNDQMTEEERDRILTQLNTLKLDWMNQYYVAAYLSDRLLEFYNYHLANIEEDLLRCITAEKKSTIINQYLEYLLAQIKSLKKQIIYSMIYRLLCAEHYQDVECDDVLSHLLEDLEKQCKINTNGESRKTPPLRRSLSPDLASQFVDTVTAYCQNNSAPEHMLETLKKLKMRNTPDQWRITPSTKKLDRLNTDPIILYAEHMLPILENTLVGLMYTEEEDKDNPIISEEIILGSSKKHPAITKTETVTYKKIKTITSAILHGETKEPYHVINKIKKLISVTRKKYIDIMEEPIDEANNPASQSLLNHFMRCEDKLNNIRIESEIYLKHTFNQILSMNENDYRTGHALTSFSLAIQNVDNFNKSACNLPYSPNTDIVLIVAKHLYEYTKNGGTPNQSTLKILRKMISNTYILSGDQLEALINIFKNMPDTLKKISSAQKESILPFIIHHIESPLLSLHSISTAIARHKSVSDRPNRIWKETSDINISEEGLAFSSLINYIENVSIRLIPEDRTITLENFDKAFSNETRFIIHPDYAKQANNMEKAKNIIKNAIADHLLKMMLDIKAYLLTEDKKINAQKLIMLMEKINAFFHGPSLTEAKKNLVELIQKSCSELLKGQLIESISQNKSINLDYLSPINTCLNINLLSSASNEGDLKEIIEKYIKSTDGTNSILSSLLTENANTPIEILIEYTNKRLNHIIATYKVASEDYSFFSIHQKNPSIQSLFEEFRKKIEKNIGNAVLSEAKWDPDQACMIELFGSSNQAQIYRSKFIIECMLNPEALSNNSLNLFLSSLNKKNHHEDNIINLQLIVSNNLTFENAIKNLINSKNWSSSIENLVRHLNQPKITQELHMALFRQIIAGSHKITSQSEVLYLMSKGLTSYKNERGPLKNIQDQANKTFYESFFGQQNIAEICLTMEPIFLDLEKTAKELTPATNFSKSEEISITKKIEKAKLFAKPYLLYGKNEDIKKFLAQLYDFSDQFKFQSEVGMLSIIDHPALENTQSLEIRKITQQIIQLENQLEGSVPSGAIAEHYIDFCEKQILDKIHSIITIQAESLTYDALSHLTNLLFHLSCDEIKLFLTKAYHDLIPDNPYWLAAINKYDNFKEMLLLAKPNLPGLSPIPENLFHPLRKIYSYSEKLNSLKSVLHKLLKQSIIREYIPIKKHSKNNKKNKEKINTNEETTNMRDLLTENSINDKELLELWLKYKNQVETLSKSRSTQNEYLIYANKLFEKISNELLSRGQNRPEIIEQIVNHTKPLTTQHKKGNKAPFMISAATVSSSHIHRDTSSFWARPKEKSFTDTLKLIHDAAVITQMMQLVSTYLQKKLGKGMESVNQFLKEFPYSLSDNLSNADKIQSLEKHTSLTKNNTPKILNAIHLYHDLAAVREGRVSIFFIKNLILKLYSEMQAEAAMQSKRYRVFIEEIQKSIYAILPDTPKPANDLKFGDGTTTLNLK